MKIAFLSLKFPRLSETFVLNQITGLIDMGCEVDIYAHNSYGETIVHDDVIEYGLLKRTFYFADLVSFLADGSDRRPSCSIETLKRKRRMWFSGNKDRSGHRGHWSRTRKYDAIIVHFGTGGDPALLLRDCGMIEGPIFVLFHGYDMSHIFHLKGDAVYDELYSKARLFLPTTEFWNRHFINMGYSADKLRVHRMGVDCRKFKPLKRRSKKNVDILSINRLVGKKGLEYAIPAVAALLKEHKNLTYRIIGGGELQGPLQRLIDNSGAGGRIILLGRKTQREILALIKSADIFLSASVTFSNGDMEGIPIAIMEAMACGLPVVATEHSGVAELVSDNRSGFLVPEKDVQALTEKLDMLIRSPEKRSAMGASGRQFVLENYNVDKLNRTLLDILKGEV